MSLKTVFLTLLSVSLATAGQLMLKSGMARVGYIGGARLSKPLDLLLQVAKTWQVLIGLTLFVLSAASWLIVVSRVPLSLAYPFAGLTYIFLALFSKFVLREHVPGMRWLGVALIVAGVIVVGRTSSPEIGENGTQSTVPSHASP